MKCVCLENTELIGNLREKPDPNFNHPSHFLDAKTYFRATWSDHLLVLKRNYKGSEDS